MKNLIIAIGLLLSIQVKGQTITELTTRVRTVQPITTASTAFNSSIAAVSQDSVVFTFTGLTTTGFVSVNYSGVLLPTLIIMKAVRVSANTATVYFYNASVTTAFTPNITVNVAVLKY